VLNADDSSACELPKYVTVILFLQGVFSNIVSGGLSGTASWIAIMPFDVIKSRIQGDEEGKYKNSWDCAMRSFREEGPTVFYRGLIMSCVRGFPAAAVTFLVYAQTLKYFCGRDKRERNSDLPPGQSSPSTPQCTVSCGVSFSTVVGTSLAVMSNVVKPPSSS
jgi:hypothetical protein